MSTKQETVQWLLDVSTGEVCLGESGICGYLENTFPANSGTYTPPTTDVMEFLKHCMGRYSVANGTSSGFPVPHPTRTSGGGYFEHEESGKSMNDESQYGLNRRKLAAWLASELENSDVA